MPPPLNNNPAILIAYATATGTTREIAERIASTLQTTTSWRVDCKSVAEIPSLHKELHLAVHLHSHPDRPAVPQRAATPPASAPVSEPAATTTGENDHTIHPNPLSAFITPEPERQVEPQLPVGQYKAIVIGSSIHAGRWIGPGRTFVAHNKDFFAGRCCSHGVKQTNGGEEGGGGSGWSTIWGMLARHAQQQEQQQQPQEETRPESSSPPKIYAFSVGMPGNDDALSREQASVEAALRKTLGRRPKPKSSMTRQEQGQRGQEEDEEEEILQKHVLFRGMWSPQKQMEMLAPRFVMRILNWCIPADSKFMSEENDERDWIRIEEWASNIGKEIVNYQ